MDFGRDELSLFNGDQAIPMNVNEAGQYIIPVANFDAQTTAEHEGTPPILEDSWVVAEDGLSVTRIHQIPRREAFTPCAEGCPIEVDRLSGSRQTVLNHDRAENPLVIEDDWRVHDEPHRNLSDRAWTGQTVFQVHPGPPEPTSPATHEAEAAPEGQWTPHRSGDRFSQLPSAPAARFRVQVPRCLVTRCMLLRFSVLLSMP